MTSLPPEEERHSPSLSAQTRRAICLISLRISSYAVLDSVSRGGSGVQGSAGIAVIDVGEIEDALTGVLGEREAQTPPSAKAFLILEVADSGVAGPEFTMSHRGRVVVGVELEIRRRRGGHNGCALVGEGSDEELRISRLRSIMAVAGSIGCCVACHPNMITLSSLAARSIRHTTCFHWGSEKRTLHQYAACSQNLVCCSLDRLFNPHFSCFFMGLPESGDNSCSVSSFTTLADRAWQAILTVLRVFEVV